MTLQERFLQSRRSFVRLPRWVQIWIVCFLAPANIAGFFLLNTPIGFWAAMAGLAVLLVNGFLTIANGGLSKVLAIPHLLFWGPLHVFVINRLFFQDVEVGQVEYIYGLILLTANTISLLFDIYDSYEWSRGNRQIAGFPDAKVVY